MSWKGEWQTRFYRPIHYSQNDWDDFTVYHSLLFGVLAETFEDTQNTLQWTVNMSYNHPLKKVPKVYGWGPLQFGVSYKIYPSYQLFVHLATSYLKDFYTSPLLFGFEWGGRKTFAFKTFSLEWDHFISFNAPRYLLRSFLGSYFHNNLLSLGSSIDCYTSIYKGWQLYSRWGFYTFYTYSKNLYYTWDSEWILSYSMHRWSVFFSFIKNFNSREFLNMQNFTAYDKALHTGIKINFL